MLKLKPMHAVLALSVGLALSGCASNNRSLYSERQPVVQRTNYTFDVNTGPGGMSLAEEERLSDWFDTLHLRYGDRVSVDDPLGSDTTYRAVENVAARYGLLISRDPPATPGYVNAGTARVVVTRARAYVPGCPDWSGKLEGNYNNSTMDGYGCAINGNLAAMVANPEHLIKGAEGTGDTVIETSNKAIVTYRSKAPTGAGALKSESSEAGK